MRVVFDTNIFISAFAVRGTQAEKALLKVIRRTDDLIISKAILDEVLSVLANKFNKDIESLSRTALFISEIAEMVKPEGRLHILRDAPDNRILECAIIGNADAVITGDKEMLRLKEYKGIKIISLKDYLSND